MDTPAGFDELVTDELPRLLAVAELLTGQPRAAESLVLDTLVTAYRSWPSLGRSRDPAAAVRRLLFSRYSSVARAERRAYDKRDSHDALELDEHPAARQPRDDGDAVWQAVLDLPLRERTALLWAWSKRGDDRMPARVALPRPPALDRMARDAARRRAVARIAATVGVSPEDEISDGRGDGRLWLEGEITATLDARHRDDVEVAPLREALRVETEHIRPTPHRGRRAVAAIAAVVTVVVALAVVQVWPGDDVDDTAAGTPLPSVAAAPDGTRLVGFGDVAVAVPSRWNSETSCRASVSDTVTYGDAVTRRNCAADTGKASVTFEALSPYPLPYRMPPTATDVVGGHQVFALGVVKGSAAYEQVVLVPISSFKMTVRSPDRSVITKVVASLRLVPDGYVVVPVCEGHRVGDAVADLEAAGLGQTIAHASGVSQRYGSPPVTFQSPTPGSIVLRGSKVRLGLPSF